MLFPKLNRIPVTRAAVDTFRGYHHALRIGAGEFYDMQNLTGDCYPVLSPRRPRLRDVVPDYGALQGMVAQDGLCFIAGGVLYYGCTDGRYASAELGLSAGEKTLVTFGSYILIFPDGKYFNTKDPNDRGSIDNETKAMGSWTATLCDGSGNPHEAATQSQTAPEEPLDGALWLDISQKVGTATKAVLKRWTQSIGAWIEQPIYTRIQLAGIGAGFAVGDHVKLSGMTNPNFWGFEERLELLACSDDHIVVQANISAKTYTELSQLTLTRQAPVLDFVFEHENRLWGCRYGKARNGEFVNEIYASKLGDFKNWNSFKGISTDSYVASCGTPGKWTGAIKAVGYPLFFKENCLHKVYGDYPSNYQVQTIPCRGVQEGCEKSLATVNEALYYKSRSGVCVYDGSLPVDVSADLGGVNYTDAVAGACLNKYYISMQSGGAWHLFVYDTLRRMWHREDSTQVDAFCTVNDALYYIDHARPELRAICGAAGAPAEEKVAWYAETGILADASPNHKYIVGLTVRMRLAVGSRVRFQAQYDADGPWEELGTVTGRALRSFHIPLRPRRCDHIRLRIEGAGDAKLYLLTLKFEEGSELR